MAGTVSHPWTQLVQSPPSLCAQLCSPDCTVDTPSYLCPLTTRPKLETLHSHASLWHDCRFMPAVDAQTELPDRDNAADAEALYSRIKQSVEQGIWEAQQDREADPERDLGQRLMGQVQRILPSWELLQS